MKVNRILAILAIIAGISAAFTRHAEHNDLYPDWAFRKERVDGEKIRYISASHLANLLYQKDQNILIYDLRPWEDYSSYHIPQALSYDKGMGTKAGVSPGTIIVYDTEEGRRLEKLSDVLPGKVYVLKGGIEAWYSQVLFPDFLKNHVRNRDRLDHILRRSRFFGGEPQNTQVLNIEAREDRYREGC
jgi:hypothetical protein